MKDIIAFWGYPRIDLIESTKKAYPKAVWVDLDINYNYPDLKFIPDNYCVIIKNIYNNALYLKDRIIKILAPTGKDKCDSAYFISHILSDMGFLVEKSVFEDKCPDIANLKLPISKSNLPLKNKIELITKNIYERKDYSYLEEVKPSFGFWGVPPNDLDILDIFPDNTWVYGWSRAVEAQYPGDWEIETYTDDIPTVFFTQSFCSKTTVAKYLANKTGGLLIDIDNIPTNSAKAKIEAFIKLR
ncbi:MAG: hypothetical protein IJ877_04710 [Candidatus Gastranaerophilales bacterium]|nr:hypothetical protein [Candidatus Gastranaerophilales bacterium]